MREMFFFSWRRMRKAANEKLSTSSVKGFYETQMTEAVLQACDLLAEPARWDRHFRRTAASMTLSVVYGYPTLTLGPIFPLVATSPF